MDEQDSSHNAPLGTQLIFLALDVGILRSFLIVILEKVEGNLVVS